MCRADVLKEIRQHPGINTRKLSKYLSATHNVPKQKICGYLSALKRRGEISILTLVPKRMSIAW